MVLHIVRLNVIPPPFQLTSSDESLSGAQNEVTSGVIAAEEIYGTIASIGCDWTTLVVGHADGVRLRLVLSKAAVG